MIEQKLLKDILVALLIDNIKRLYKTYKHKFRMHEYPQSSEGIFYIIHKNKVEIRLCPIFIIGTGADTNQFTIVEFKVSSGRFSNLVLAQIRLIFKGFIYDIDKITTEAFYSNAGSYDSYISFREISNAHAEDYIYYISHKVDNFKQWAKVLMLYLHRIFYIAYIYLMNSPDYGLAYRISVSCRSEDFSKEYIDRYNFNI